MNGFVEVNFTKVTIDGVASSKYTCIKMHKHGYIYILDFFWNRMRFLHMSFMHYLFSKALASRSNSLTVYLFTLFIDFAEVSHFSSIVYLDIRMSV